MPGYTTLNRFSRVQLQSEERKQEAHLRKISEMQSQTGIDNGQPRRCPHLHQGFVKHLNERRQEIHKENEIKLRKLSDIMTARSEYSPRRPSHPTNQNRRTHTVHSSQDNTEYLDRVAKAKGKYNVHTWKKEYEQHQEHLRLRKNNKVFSPLNIHSHQQRSTKSNSVASTTQTTPT